MSQFESYGELKKNYYEYVHRTLIPLSEAPPDTVFYEIDRESARVGPDQTQQGMLLPESLNRAMDPYSTTNSDGKIVKLLVRLFKKCQQVSCVSNAALKSNNFQRAKDILALLGRTLWVVITKELIALNIAGEDGSFGWDEDNEYETMTMKISVMKNIFWGECYKLADIGKSRTCYSVFASFLESMALGAWDDGLFRTNIADVNEYEGSDSATIVVDSLIT